MGRRRSLNSESDKVKIVIVWDRDKLESENVANLLCEINGIATLHQPTVLRSRVAACLADAIASALDETDLALGIEHPVFDEAVFNKSQQPKVEVKPPKSPMGNQKAKSASKPKVEPKPEPQAEPEPELPHAKLAVKHNWTPDTEEWLIPMDLLSNFREWKQAQSTDRKVAV